MKSRKAAGRDKIPPKVWKARKFDIIFLRLCKSVYKQNTTEKWSCFSSSFTVGDLGITKNNWGITLTVTAAKVYNVMQPEIENVRRKNQNDFRKNWSTPSHILTIHPNNKRLRAKNLEATLLLVHLIPYAERRWDNTTSICSPQRNCYRNNHSL